MQWIIVVIVVTVMTLDFKMSGVFADEIIVAPDCGYKAWRNLAPGKKGICVCEKGWNYVTTGFGDNMYCRESCRHTNAACSEGTTCAEVEDNQHACVCAPGYTLSPYGECLKETSVSRVVGFLGGAIILVMLVMARTRGHWSAWTQLGRTSVSAKHLFRVRKICQ